MNPGRDHIMMRIATIGLTLLCACAVGATEPARADDRPDHFEGETSTSFADAIDRLADANRRLRELTEGRTPTPAELHEIHVASYTMENAIARLRADLDTAAAALGRLHLASERGESAAVESAAREYLGADTDGTR